MSRISITPLRTARGITHELIGGLRLAADASSFLRYACDVILYRLLRVVDLPSRGRERRIRLHGSITLTYRLDRGDIESIREVWIDECYRLPFEVMPKVVIDLGAHIGLTSLWLARRYGCSTVIAVEPLHSNASLARRNLANNRISAEVIEAAVGPNDGTVSLEVDKDSNRSRVGSDGSKTRMVSMDYVLHKLRAVSSPDLVKMDIEGGEAALLSGDLTWLRQIQSMIVEFHPTIVDYPALVDVLKRAGFRYIAANSARVGSMDGFMRQD